ncbi:hypothetical protein [Nocardia sp. 348MFTsu5.1]|uniref:hypothetical protein n=1 Tax=Nocardia sp. 348MFTsu5.1 TaxID=1172185 RepID=UPI00037ED938|nr:hypothetical protein [Nocardia sp. 348MFTsu5.1]
MSREIIFIHGRSQQGKDSSELKQEWIDSLNEGLGKSDPSLPPITTDQVRFPFYGDTLDRLAKGFTDGDVPDVILRGEPNLNSEAKRFLFDVLTDVQQQQHIPDAEISAQTGIAVAERGPLNWPWMRAILQKLDQNGKMSAVTIALATYDVFQYLTNRTIRRRIDDGVIGAFTPGTDSVVVAHSLGTVVAYTLLMREGTNRNWKVPELITVGSPLAVNAIRDRAPGIGDVGGNRTPPCVGSWFNAMDPHDAVALHPLDAAHFAINPPTPAIENKTDVDNQTPNHHGISGYLSDPVVARRIYDALQE